MLRKQKSGESADNQANQRTIDLYSTLATNSDLGPRTAQIVGEAIRIVTETASLTEAVSTSIVETSLANTLANAKEKPDASARSFMPEFMISERAFSKSEGKESEDICGGAGVWGYQIPIDDVDENDLIPIIERALSVSYHNNQRVVKELFEIFKGRVGINDFKFEERFATRENFKKWRDLLGKHRSLSTRMAYKDWDCYFGETEPVKRDDGYIPLISKDDGFRWTPEPKSIFQIQICDENKLENGRKFNELASNGQVAKVILVKDSKTGRIKKIETWFPHFTADEEQGWVIFEAIMKDLAHHIKQEPEETTEVLRKTKFSRLNGKDRIIKDSTVMNKDGIEWTQFDVKDTFRTSEEEEIILKQAIQAFPRQEGAGQISLSALHSLLWMSDFGGLSSYVCTKAENSAGLQFALVPNITILRKMLNEYGYNGISDKFNIYWDLIAKIANLISTDQKHAKEGHGTPAVLFTYVPESAKKIFENFFVTADTVVRKGTLQTSFVSHKTIPELQYLLKNISFTSANNLTTANNVSRMNCNGDVTYTVCTETTFDDYVSAKEFLLDTLEVKVYNEELLKESLIYKLKVRNLEHRAKSLSLCENLLEANFDMRLNETEALKEKANLKELHDTAQSKISDEIQKAHLEFAQVVFNYLKAN